MKNNRKVKSLIPRKNDISGNIQTILLLVLSFILCLGSASLMTTSVGAVEVEDNETKMIFSGNNNNTEVLYNLYFVDPKNLSDEVKEEVYMQNNSIHFKPNQIVLETTGENTFREDKYINILGGEKNGVESDNITIIAGSGNTIRSNHDNVTLLGGEKNEVKGISSGVPAVIVGGNKNTIDGNNGNVIVGGSGNTIKGKKSVILGGEGNLVNFNGENVVVGGKKVKATVNNIFAFSDSESDFQPESNNAFYLNLTNGVGIGADAVKKGVSVSGAVGLGKIDILTIICNQDNIGVEGVWYVDGSHGCLVGCTQASQNKWELLDRGEFCENKCSGNDKCVLSTESADVHNQSYSGHCTDGKPDDAIWCTTGEWESYENVVFQTFGVENQSDCNINGDNKCVYYCAEGGANCIVDNEPEPQNDENGCTGNRPESSYVVEGSRGQNKVKWHHREKGKDEECTFKCNEGYFYDEETDECKSEVELEMVECKVPEGENRSNYIIKQVLKICTYDLFKRFCITPVCECKEGYIKSGDICVLANEYKCIGDIPDHAYFITGSDENLPYDIDIQVFDMGKGKNEKCAYECEEGHYAFQGECIPCPEGTTWDGGVCLNMVNCDKYEGYYVNEMNKCAPYGGYCTYEDANKQIKTFDWNNRANLGNINISKYLDLIPWSGSKELKCVDSDEFKGSSNNNTCTYKCAKDNYCNYDVNPAKCSAPSCNWYYVYNFYNKNDKKRYHYKNSEDRFKYAQRGGNMGHYTFSYSYTPEEIVYLYDKRYIDNDNIPGYTGDKKNESDYLTQKEMDYIKQIGNGDVEAGINKIRNIKTDSDFHSIFDYWPEKCVYWCPEKNRNYNYDKNTNRWNYACIAESTIDNIENPSAPDPSCANVNFYGFKNEDGKKEIDYKKNNPQGNNIAWQYVDRDTFKDDNTTPCIWSCPEGYVPISGYTPFNNKNIYNTTLFAKGAYNTCYKSCPAGKYLSHKPSSYTFTCETCPSGGSVGVLRTGKYEGTVYSAYRGCECTGGRSWNSTELQCECTGGRNWNSSKSKCECTGGKTWNSSTSQCECTGGASWNPSISQCECPIGHILDGDDCVCDVENDWEIYNGVCVPKAECPKPGEWCLPKGGVKRECVSCPEGRSIDRDTCKCS